MSNSRQNTYCCLGLVYPEDKYLTLTIKFRRINEKTIKITHYWTHRTQWIVHYAGFDENMNEPIKFLCWYRKLIDILNLCKYQIQSWSGHLICPISHLKHCLNKYKCLAEEKPPIAFDVAIKAYRSVISIVLDLSGELHVAVKLV